MSPLARHSGCGQLAVVAYVLLAWISWMDRGPCSVPCRGETVPSAGAPADLIAARRAAQQQFINAADRLFQDASIATDVRQAWEAWRLPYRTQRRAFFLPVIDPQATTTTQRLYDSPAGAAFIELQRGHAQRLLALMEKSREVPGLAAEMALEALREVPDCEPAHRWIAEHLRQYPLRQEPLRARRGTTRDATLGWSSGQYWRIVSPHYHLLTTGDPRDGQRLAEQLERLHALTQPLLLHAIDLPAQRVRRRVAMRVALFSSRQEYIDHLKPVISLIESTIGYYDPHRRMSYFYTGTDDTRTTILHEATHQVLHETWQPTHAVGEDRDFWLVEGIALYMESSQFGIGCAYVGGADSDRLQFARYRALQENTLTPAAELIRRGRIAFQQSPDLGRLYSQTAGLTHYLMDGDKGAHRVRLLQYLYDIYHQERLSAAQQIDPVSPMDWDAEYLEFLRVRDTDLADLLPRSSQRLCLGQTHVTADGLQSAAEYKSLEWLDLAHLPLTDDLLSKFGAQPHLRQLNVEATAITGKSLTTIGQWRMLEELDLSHVPLAEADFGPLANLAELRILWLTGTGATNACVEVLVGLKKLEQVELQGTGISPQGIERLRRELPAAEIRGPTG